MMLLSICFNIFIICYIGEILTEQVSKLYIINSSCYKTYWNAMDENHDHNQSIEFSIVHENWWSGLYDRLVLFTR